MASVNACYLCGFFKINDDFLKQVETLGISKFLILFYLFIWTILLIGVVVTLKKLGECILIYIMLPKKHWKHCFMILWFIPQNWLNWMLKIKINMYCSGCINVYDKEIYVTIDLFGSSSCWGSDGVLGGLCSLQRSSSRPSEIFHWYLD